MRFLMLQEQVPKQVSVRVVPPMWACPRGSMITGVLSNRSRRYTEMQARLTYIQFPLTLVALFFAMTAALLLGGVLGYELKPTPVTATTRIVVEQPGPAASIPYCVWTASHKGC